MAYFGGGGVQGEPLHPSLRAYVECFSSPPFPKTWPRGGGVWDQDPELMRDFRAIRDYEVEWKHNQEQLERMSSGSEGGSIGNPLEEYLNELEESGEEPLF